MKTVLWYWIFLIQLTPTVVDADCDAGSCGVDGGDGGAAARCCCCCNSRRRWRRRWKNWSLIMTWLAMRAEVDCKLLTTKSANKKVNITRIRVDKGEKRFLKLMRKYQQRLRPIEKVGSSSELTSMFTNDWKLFACWCCCDDCSAVELFPLSGDSPWFVEPPAPAVPSSVCAPSTDVGATRINVL